MDLVFSRRQTELASARSRSFPWLALALLSALAPSPSHALQLFDYVQDEYRAFVPRDVESVSCSAGQSQACDHLKYKLTVTHNHLYPVEDVEPIFFDDFELPPLACDQIAGKLGVQEPKAHWTCTFFGIREAMKYELLNLSAARCTGSASVERIGEFWEKASRQCGKEGGKAGSAPPARLDQFFGCLSRQRAQAPSPEAARSLTELARLSKEMTLFQEACRADQGKGAPAVSRQRADYCRWSEFLLFQDTVKSWDWLRANEKLLSAWQPGFEPVQAPSYFYGLHACEKEKKKHRYTKYPFDPFRKKEACEPPKDPAQEALRRFVTVSMSAASMVEAADQKGEKARPGHSGGSKDPLAVNDLTAGAAVSKGFEKFMASPDRTPKERQALEKMWNREEYREKTREHYRKLAQARVKKGAGPKTALDWIEKSYFKALEELFGKSRPGKADDDEASGSRVQSGVASGEEVEFTVADLDFTPDRRKPDLDVDRVDGVSAPGKMSAAEFKKEREETRRIAQEKAKKAKERKEKLVEKLGREFRARSEKIAAETEAMRKDGSRSSGPAPETPPKIKRKLNGDSIRQKAINARLQSTVEQAAKDLKAGRRTLPPEMKNVGELLLLSEIEDLDLPEEQRAREREKALKEWHDTVNRYKEHWKSMKDLPYEKRLSKLMEKANLEFTRRYVDVEEDGSAFFMLQCLKEDQFCNCLGNSRFNTALTLAVVDSRDVPDGKRLLLQDLGYHAAAVDYDTRNDTYWDLMERGEPKKELLGKFYHPAELMNAELIRKGAKGVPHADLVVKVGRVDMTPAERKTYTENTAARKKAGEKRRASEGLLSQGLAGDVNLKDVTGRKRHERSESNLGRSDDGEPSHRDDIGYMPISSEKDLAKAKGELRKILTSEEFKVFMSVLKNPLPVKGLDFENRGEEVASALVAVFEDVFEKAKQIDSYLSRSNQSTEEIRRPLAEEFPELMELKKVIEELRAPFDESRPDQRERLKQRFELFEAMGPDAWTWLMSKSYLRDFFEGKSRPLLKRFLGLLGSGAASNRVPEKNLRGYFLDPSVVGFRRPESRDGGSPADPADTTEKYLRSSDWNDDPASDGTEGRRRTEVRGGTQRVDGSLDSPGKARQEKTQKPEIELDPIVYAQFVRSQSDFEIGAAFLDRDNVLSKWTPDLTAALRDKGVYEEDFVEWFLEKGYHYISSVRPIASKVITGPYGYREKIPKDLAVLYIDFLLGRDGTDADRSAAIDSVKEHYGSVEAYIEQVRKDFAKADAAGND